jgi:phosphate transport system protein
MGSMVEKAIIRAMDAMKSRDMTLARQVIADDTQVDNARFEIEERCIELMATQQPMASDLRRIISVFSIIAELERIGDYAEGTAKIAIMLGDEPPLKPLIDLPRMAEKTVNMLHRSLIAFVNDDAETARAIVKEDDEIDNLNTQIYRELLSFMIEDPKTITRATRLIWAGHNMERSADRVTNICERIVYIVSGKMEELGASKY